MGWLTAACSSRTLTHCEPCLGAAGTCRQASQGCQCPLWWWQWLRDDRGGKPPPGANTLLTLQGLGRDWRLHCQVESISPATTHGTGLGDNQSPCARWGDLVQPSELSSGGIKGFAKTTWRSGDKPQAQTRHLVHRLHLPGVPSVSLATVGDTPGCVAALPSLPYAARSSAEAVQQISRQLAGAPASLKLY